MSPKLKQGNYHWIINYLQYEDGLDQITTVNTATCHRCWCMHTCEPSADFTLNITYSFVPTRENKLLYTLNEIILLVSRSNEEIMQGNLYQTLSMCYWWEEQNNAVGINNVNQPQLFTQLSKRGGQQIILSSVRRVTIFHCTPGTRPDTHSLHFLITSSPSSCGGDLVILQWQNSFCFRLGLVRSCHQQLCFSCWD